MSERRLNFKSYSSKSKQITRVKSKRKQAKKTVGIIISPKLLAEAREQNLNRNRTNPQLNSEILIPTKQFRKL